MFSLIKYVNKQLQAYNTIINVVYKRIALARDAKTSHSVVLAGRR